MADFNKVYARVIGNEGGYANVSGDKGGETYKGVARKYHPTWKGWPIIDGYKKQHGKINWNFHIPDPVLDQLVKQFFYNEFWLKIKGDQIKNEDIAANFFDMHINSGSAVKIMQTALNQIGNKLPIDNKMGADTLTAINKANPNILNTVYIAGRKAHYKKLVENDPSQAKFIDGWLDRLTNFTTVTGGISAFLLLSALGAVYYFFFKQN